MWGYPVLLFLCLTNACGETVDDFAADFGAAFGLAVVLKCLRLSWHGQMKYSNLGVGLLLTTKSSQPLQSPCQTGLRHSCGSPCRAGPSLSESPRSLRIQHGFGEYDSQPARTEALFEDQAWQGMCQFSMQLFSLLRHCVLQQSRVD